MRILIFGANGMLGHKLCQVLSERHEVVATLRGTASGIGELSIYDRTRLIENIDVTDGTAISRAFAEAEPDQVINAIGLIKQDPAAVDVPLCLALNSIFPHRLAAECEKRGARLITISTDCVYNGTRGMYSEDDIPDARDLYGMSKFLGEIKTGNALTLRTSIIGRELSTSHSLLEWFLSNRGGSVDGYTKAIYSGFPTVVFADIIASIIEDHPSLAGVLHISSDPISKFDLLNMVDRHFATGTAIMPNDTLNIDRSLDSSRFRKLTGFVPMPWEEMTAIMASDAAQYDSLRNDARG